jgi:hypothetical protein
VCHTAPGTPNKKKMKFCKLKMSLIREWKKLIEDEEAKLEKINREIMMRPELVVEQEKQIRLIKEIKESYNRYNFNW